MKNEYFISEPTSFMYLYPDSKSEVTDELLYGTRVTFFDESYAGFVFCKTEYGYTGYVDVSHLSPKEQTGEKFVVTSSFCDIYEYPEYRFSPMITLVRGSVIEGERKRSRDPKFVCIKSGEKDFFIPSGHIAQSQTLYHFETAEKKRRQIIKTAFSYLGTPYRWGGKSTSGIDCSGFCFMVYSLCGLSLYRDAEFDARYIKEIDFSELLPGDLIYYNGHVVLYVGNGEYIHSSATLGGVKVGSFDENSKNYYPRLASDIVKCARCLIFQ